MLRLWLIFAQAATIAVAALFVVSTFRPEWLPARGSAPAAVVQSASTSSGAGIIQWSFGSAQNDQWKPTLNGDGTYTFINRHSGLMLEDPGSSTSTSTQMDQWGANGGANQKWKLIKQ